MGKPGFPAVSIKRPDSVLGITILYIYIQFCIDSRVDAASIERTGIQQQQRTSVVSLRASGNHGTRQSCSLFRGERLERAPSAPLHVFCNRETHTLSLSVRNMSLCSIHRRKAATTKRKRKHQQAYRCCFFTQQLTRTIHHHTTATLYGWFPTLRSLVLISPALSLWVVYWSSS